MYKYNFVLQICCFRCLFHLNQNFLARNDICFVDGHWINPLTFDFAEKIWNSHWLMQCKRAYQGKSNWLSQKMKSKLKSTNSMKSQMRVSFDHWNWLLTKTKENRLWKFDKPWIKRLKDVVLFGKNSFQMRENEKAWWKAIALLREIELEKLISVLTRCTWCADDCVRGCEVTYLYISGKITIPKPIFGLGGVRVKILVGNDLPRNDLPYSKGFMWFECP